ncbi:MAG TPA: M23 family metallopeptidase [Longimicrobium sp.]|nr:M23 family metallopeptidase [Longimicrobium sp.]
MFRNLPLDVEARPAPEPVQAEDGRVYLVYRLFVTSWLDVDLRFRSLEVLDAGSGAVLVSYDSAALADPRRQRTTLYIPDTLQADARRTLPAGRTATVAVGISLAAADAVPGGLRHRITFDSVPGIRLITDSGDVEAALAATSQVLAVDRRPPPVLSPPLRGSGWRCNNGLALSNGHAALYPFRDSRLRVPQRFGCDFSRVDSGGNVLPSPFPNEISNEMFYGYGADVLAVANGVVVFVHDGTPDNVPRADGQTIMPVPLTNETVSGNWVALDIGGGRYAFYAHLIPGSIRVRAGQRVRQGDVLGRLGNSGNSVGPHLHFHVGDAPALNGGEGQPYVFSRYHLLGRGKPASDQPPSEQRSSLPLEGAVLSFPDP